MQIVVPSALVLIAFEGRTEENKTSKAQFVFAEVKKVLNCESEPYGASGVA